MPKKPTYKELEAQVRRSALTAAEYKYLKLSEDQRNAHIHFLESLEQIDQAIKQETDVEKMLGAVLKTVFKIFECDRVWLLYPCDPDAPSFRVPVEINRPEYPGAKTLNLEVPMSPSQAQDMRDALASKAPAIYGPGTGRPLSISTQGQFSVKTQMFQAIYPKVGKPWMFGMHQCSHPRIWAEAEQSLFKEIGRRISDGLSSVLSFRELKESEQRFRAMFEQAAVGVALCDCQTGAFIKVNQKYADIVGFSIQELEQLSFNEIAHPDDLNKGRSKFHMLLGGKIKEDKFDKRYMRKDGSVIWGRATVSPMWKRGEAPDYYIVILEDITDKKIAEEALQESEARYKDIFNSLLDIYIETGPNGNIIEVSPSFEKYMGHTREAVIGKPVSDFYADLNKKEQVVKALKSDGFLNDFEVEAVHKNGSLVPFSISSTLLRDTKGKPRKLIGMIRHIGERKKTETALRKQKSLFETMFNTIPDAVVVTNTYGEIQLANKSVTSLFGYTPEEILGKSIKLFYEKQDEYDDFGTAVFDQDPEKQNDSYVSCYKSKKGREFSGETFGAKLFDEKNQWIGNFAIIRDITEREQAELRLRQAQKMESIGNLAGGIAHDFNNILSSIIGFTELALEDAEPGTDHEDNLQEVFTAGKRAKDLVKQILVFARQSEEKVKPVQVASIVNEVLKFVRSSIPATITIRKDIKSTSLVMSSPIQIHQIIMNLCTNAAYAMEDAGGVLGVSLRDFNVAENSAMIKEGLKPGDYVELAISDTGVGISSENIDYIFDPYFTTKDLGAGTGMGLAVVHGIVENNAGKVVVESQLNEGTVFRAYLPVAMKHKADQIDLPEQLPCGTERILFVDDEVPIAKMGGRVLRSLGYTVQTQSSSVEALALFQANPGNFDLVITDMTMPNLAGDMLAVKLMTIRPDIPVILCTGYSKKASDQTALYMGIKAFAYKPIVKADLAKTVRKVLDQAQAEPGE